MLAAGQLVEEAAHVAEAPAGVGERGGGGDKRRGGALEPSRKRTQGFSSLR
jgi:hypothetical protein